MKNLIMMLMSLGLLGCATGSFANDLKSSGKADTYDRSHPLGLPYYQPYGMLSMKYETPHVAWGKPLAGGSIKALILAPEWTQRESVELAQRLDLDVTPWMCYNTRELMVTDSDWAFSSFLVSQQLVCNLLEKYLKNTYDVYVVGKLDWTILPARSRFELLKKVSEGTGLVLVCPQKNEELDLALGKHPTEGADEILNGVPWQSLPRLRQADPKKLVRTGIFGKGRIVALDYQQPPALPYKKGLDAGMHSLTPNWVQVRAAVDNGKGGSELLHWPDTETPEQELVPYEYYHSLVARAVRWAAGRSGSTRLAVQLPVAIQAQTEIQAQVKAEPVPAKVELAIRDEFGVVLSRLSVPSRKPAVTLPGLPAGKYFLDVWARDAKGAVLDWGSWSFAVQGNDVIAAIRISQRVFNRGDFVQGTVTLDKAPQAGDSLQVSLWDNLNRKTDESAIPAKELTSSFSLGPLSPLCTMHQVRAELVRAGKIIARNRYEFPVRVGKNFDDFSEVLWAGDDNTYPSGAMLRKLQTEDEGDVAYGNPGLAWSPERPKGMISNTTAMDVMARNIARANLLIFPYNNRFGCLGAPAETHVVDPTWNLCSGQTLNKVRGQFITDSIIYGPYGPYGWAHGDETHYSQDPDVDWCVEALARFRKEADERYGTLEALNTEWKTTYKTWTEVMPLAFADAKKSGNFAPWVVHRLASDALFAEFFKYAGDALRLGDAGARTGFDGGCGLSGPNLGSDWRRLAQNIQLFQTYHGESMQMEVWRSFAPPESVRGLYYGTYGPTWTVGPNTIEYCHYFPWYSVFHSLNTTWFWAMGGPINGYAPDLTSLAFMESRTRALRAIKGGIGKLLLASRRQDDGIAIHWSESSRITDAFYQKKDGDWCKGYEDSVTSLGRLLEDAGYQYNFVAYDQIEGGALAAQRIKVLILPHSRAISSREAEQIRAFVQNGGVVLADIVPGLHNACGTRQEKSLLADLFPSEQAGTVTPVGQGKAVLYGEAWNDYGGRHTSEKGWKELKGRWKELETLLTEQAGLPPAVRVAAKGDKAEMPPTEIARFETGGLEFAGLIRSWFMRDYDPYPAEIEFSHEGYIYDVLAGSLVGHGNKIARDLDYRAALFAVSPYRVDKMELTADSRVQAGAPAQVAMRLKITGAEKCGLHVFRLTVFAPDQTERRWYAQNVSAPDGAATVMIPFALNDPPGAYRIQVKDVMSGVTGETRVKLQ